MKVVFSARANREFQEAADYLISENPTVARWFADALDNAFENLRQHPKLGRPTTDPLVRVITLSRFPYRIFYEIEGETIYILSIFHTSRRPE